MKDNHWQDVGYHYFIKKDGTVQSGRNLELIPAAQMGHNTGTIAICLSGLIKEKFTERQFISLIGLCKVINDSYDKKLTFHGHKEVDLGRACPVFDYKKILGLDENGHSSVIA